MSTPSQKLAVITITYNNYDGLRRTLESVKKQKTRQWEYIIIDGASTDETLSLLEANSSFIDHHLSEPDDGIADAFNKGIQASSADYLIFLNSGDILEEQAISRSLNEIERSSSESPYVIVAKVKTDLSTSARKKGQKKPKFFQYLRNTLPHQGMLISRNAFKDFGLYDLTFSLGMDYEWSLRLLPYWNRIKFCSFVISAQEPDGRSIANFQKTFWKYHIARRKHNILPYNISKLIYILYTARKRISNSIKRLIR